MIITARFSQTEKIGDILYLDQNSIFSDSGMESSIN